MPDLDLPGPVAGGGGGRQDVMLSDAQAGLAVGEQRVQNTSAAVVVEVSRAGGAPRGQDGPVQRELALHRVSLHLVSLVSPPLVHPVGPLGGEHGHVVPVGLGNKGLLQGVERQAGARESLLVDLVGDLGRGPVVPGDERAVGRVSADAVGARDEVHATSQEQDVQGLLDPCFVLFHHLEGHKIRIKPFKIQSKATEESSSIYDTLWII